MHGLNEALWRLESAGAPLAHAVHRLAGGLRSFDWIVLGSLLLLTHLAGRVGIWAYCLVALPGTIAHELAHYLVALVLRARPSPPSIIPERTATGWRLGAVEFQPGLLRTVPIALAPFALAPLGLWWAGAALPGLAFGPLYILHAWGASSAFAASLPSSQDWSIAAPALFLAALILAAVAFL